MDCRIHMVLLSHLSEFNDGLEVHIFDLWSIDWINEGEKQVEHARRFGKRNRF
jgi:hypothetical protein